MSSRKQKMVNLRYSEKGSGWRRGMEAGASIRHRPASDISIKHQWPAAGHHSNCTESPRIPPQILLFSGDFPSKYRAVPIKHKWICDCWWVCVCVCVCDAGYHGSNFSSLNRSFYLILPLSFSLLVFLPLLPLSAASITRTTVSRQPTFIYMAQLVLGQAFCLFQRNTVHGNYGDDTLHTATMLL